MEKEGGSLEAGVGVGVGAVVGVGVRHGTFGAGEIIASFDETF